MNPVTTEATFESYPRQRARTRGFQLGRPRNFHLTSDRALFIRSASGNDSAGSLWTIDLTSGQEHCIVDVRNDIPADNTDGLPAAERARRERMREVASGITAFSVDAAGATAVFAASGIPYLVDLSTAQVTALPAPGPVVDPRISSNGEGVSFVVNRAVYVVSANDIAAGATCIAKPSHEDETWGLSDFVASEELSRFRGHWWLPEVDDTLLVERFDETDVPQWWIADAAHPASEPASRRYPSAGSNNALVELWLIRADLTQVQISWDSNAFPYLASVAPAKSGTIVELLNRSQNLVSICVIDVEKNELREIQRRTDTAWIDVMPGVPCLDEESQLLEIVNDVDADTFRLVRNGVFISPPKLQVRALISSDKASAIVIGSRAATTQTLYRLNYSDGSCTALTDESLWCSGASDGSNHIIMQANPDTPGTTFTAHAGNQTFLINNFAESPNVNVHPHYASVGTDELETCLLWPTDHIQGSRQLPIVLSPYGGPHGQRVMRNAAAFTSEQWIADQGFAVIVTDNRGTPGRGPAWERSVHNDLATYPVQDQVAALLALGELHADLDTSRVGIRGWSFGGYLATLALLERPDIFSAAVAGAPVTDWALYDTAYTERYLGMPQTNPDAYAKTSLLNKAEQLEKPLLLIHGLADDNVFAAHTLQFSSALLAAGKVHSVVPLSGVTHMTPQEIVAENLLRLEIDFFKEHLGD